MFECFVVQLAHCRLLVLAEVMYDRVLVQGSLVEDGNTVSEEDQRWFLRRRVVQSHQLTVECLNRDSVQVLLKVLNQVGHLHLEIIAFITVLLGWRMREREKMREGEGRGK